MVLQKEKISDLLALTRNGERQVMTCVGQIDVLTPIEIINVDCIQSWTRALGTIVANGILFPCHTKKIYLYSDYRTNKYDINMHDIIGVCNFYRVRVEIHDANLESEFINDFSLSG
jgi:hypothetical protein